MPGRPYLHSRSSKLHNEGPEIGFPNLSVDSIKNISALCNSSLSSPTVLKRNRSQFTCLPTRSEGFFRRPFCFLNLLVIFVRNALKGPSFLNFFVLV